MRSPDLYLSRASALFYMQDHRMLYLNVRERVRSGLSSDIEKPSITGVHDWQLTATSYRSQMTGER